MTAPKLNYGKLSLLGRAIVQSNESVFTDMFVHGLSQRMSRKQLADLMESTFSESISIEMGHQPRCTETYAQLARRGMMTYLTSKDGIKMDAQALVDANYEKFGVSAGTIPRTRPPTPAERARKARASASKKPVKSNNRSKSRGSRR